MGCWGCVSHCTTRHFCVSVCVFVYGGADVKSLVGCDSCLHVVLSELMAAVWINGFVNGQEATGRVYSVSIYNRGNMLANQNNGRENKKKNNTDTLITVILRGVQSSDSERLEQPLLTSFVQAGNINSS